MTNGSSGPAGRLASLWRNRFFRFLVAGGLNAVFGYLAFALLYALGLHYAVASFLAVILGVAFNFLTYGGMVFDCLKRSALPRFVAVYGVIYVLGVCLLWLAERAGLDLYLANALFILPLAAASYILQKLFVFRGPKTANIEECLM
jgi:putative flippase GtrA